MKYFFVFIFVFLPLLLYSKTIYTTSLKVGKLNQTGVKISFKCNTNKGHFQLYRSDWEIIKDPQDAENSDLVFDDDLEATNINKLSSFEISDMPEKSGSYFYFIRYGKGKIKKSELQPGFNSLIKPFIFKTEYKLKEKQETNNEDLSDKKKQIDLKVSGVFVRVKEGIPTVFWDINRISNEKTVFRIYRISGNEDPKNCLKRSADAKVEDDFFYEDKELKTGVFYRYLVLYGTNSRIESGRNLTENGFGVFRKIIRPKTEKKLLKEKIFLKFDKTNTISTNPRERFPYLIKSYTNYVVKIGKKIVKKSIFTNKKIIILRTNQIKPSSKESNK